MNDTELDPPNDTDVPKSFAELWAELWLWTNVRPSGEFFFRGQGGRKPIIPKIGRSDYHYDAAREQDLFKVFKSTVRPLITVQPANDWEWLALAQHHGVPTRLVDWSTNVLVACWFAVTSFIPGDAIIYALDAARADIRFCDTATGRTRDGPSLIDPLDFTAGIYLIESSPVSPRITTQRGIFTAHGAPQVELSIPPADEFIIPETLRSEMQAQLLDIGLDASHIYPGIDGLCQTLDWRFKSGKGFSALV